MLRWVAFFAIGILQACASKQTPAPDYARPAPSSAVQSRHASARVVVASGWARLGSRPADLEYAVQLCRRYAGHGSASGAAQEPMSCTAQAFGDEQPTSTVYVPRFAIDRYEVSQLQYRACVLAGRCASSTIPLQDHRLIADHYPVAGVSWYQAERYCAFVGGKLPNDAQWVRAARGDSWRRFPWGDVFSSRLANHGLHQQPAGRDGHRYAGPVRGFPDGRSRFGLLHMAGNVWEWTSDAYRKPGSNAEQSLRTLRGGSWRSNPDALRVSNRAAADPSREWPDVGIRCVYPHG